MAIGSLKKWFGKQVDQASRVYDQANPFDNGLSAKTRSAATNKSVKQQAQGQAKQVAAGVARPVAQFGNTVRAGAVGVVHLPAVAKASVFGSDQDYANAIRQANSAVDTSLAPNSGIMHAGSTFKDPRTAATFNPRDIAGQSINYGTQLGSMVVPTAKIGTGVIRVASRPIQNAVLGGAGSAAGQYTATGKVNVGQVAKDAGAASVLGEAGSLVKGLRNAPRDVREHTLKIATNDVAPQSIPTSRLTSYEGAPDKSRVNFYKQQIKAGKQLDPVIALKDSTGKFGIEDGKHRFQAYKELGIRSIPTKVTSHQAIKDSLEQGGTKEFNNPFYKGEPDASHSGQVPGDESKPKTNINPVSSTGSIPPHMEALKQTAESVGAKINFINRKPLKSEGVHGKYRNGEITIYLKDTKGQLRSPEDLANTVHHEIGHHVDYLRRGIIADPMGDSIKSHDGSLVPMRDSHIYFRDYKLKDAQGVRSLVPRRDGSAMTQKEVYADAYRLYMTQRQELQQVAPNIYKDIDSHIHPDKPVVQQYTSPKLPEHLLKLVNSKAPKQAIGNKGERQNIPEQNLPQNQPTAGSVPSGKQVQVGKAKGIKLAQTATPSLEGENHIPGGLQQTGAMIPQAPTNIVNPSLERQRGFIQTIIDDPSTSPKVKNNISSLYKVRNTRDLQTKAANLVKTNPDMALRVAQSDTSDIGVAVGSELLGHLQRTGQFETAIQLAPQLAKTLTEHGRASQAASIYGKLTPEGILRFTAQQLNKYNKINGRDLKMTPEQALDLTNKAEAVQRMPLGRDRDMATMELVRDVHQLMPSSFVDKISTAQTIAQLLNSKTMIRNVGGNTMFGGLENVSQVLAAGLDKAVGAATHNRTTALPQLGAQYHGAVTGLKQGAQEAWKGINLGPNTQFDLNDVPTFRDHIMGNLERTMGVALRSTDRAAYQAAFDDTVQGLMKANHLTQPTTDILEQANINGMYRTFQDNSKAAQLFSKLKGALNAVGFEQNGKSWGLGDLILKYPKTPGNIIARGIDYSPLGVIKALKTISDTALTGAPFDQHTFVNATSRAVVGTGTIGVAGAVLGSLGIITEKPSQDTDTRNLQKKTGLGGYQINISALKRFVASGFNKDKAKIQPGDTLVSYDWAQPLAIPLSAGAAIGKGDNPGQGAVNTLDTAAQGINTLVEQPLVTGVNTFSNNIKNKGVVGALGETAKGAPASFVPTVSNQAKQLTDNTTRNTYDPNMAQDALNKVKNRIPGLSKGLQPQVDTLGDNKQTYQGGTNNPVNVLLNPAFVNKYDPSGAAKLPLDILNNSGETQQMPRTVKTSQTVNGKPVRLTAQQNTDLQRYDGAETKKVYEQLSKDPKFMALSDSEKAKQMSNKLSDITKAGKVKILGDTPGKSQAKAVNAIIAGKTPGYEPKAAAATNYAEKFQKAQDDFNKNSASWTPVQRASKETELKKLSVQKGYDNDTVKLYGMSKQDAYNFLTTNKDGQKIADKLLTLDKAMVDAGVSDHYRFINNKTGEVDFVPGRDNGGITLSSSGGSKVSSVAKSNGIPENIFAALIKQESGGNQNARSNVGAIGLTQLMPATAKKLGVDPYNADQNLQGGAKYLKQMYDKFGNWEQAVAAYHGGPDPNSWGPKTQAYVKAIMSNSKSLKPSDIALSISSTGGSSKSTSGSSGSAAIKVKTSSGNSVKLSSAIKSSVARATNVPVSEFNKFKLSSIKAPSHKLNKPSARVKLAKSKSVKITAKRIAKVA